MTAIVNTPEQTQTLTVIGEQLKPLLTNAMGSPLEIFDTTGDEGMGPPPHAHDWSETYVVLEGSVDVVIGDAPPARLDAGMTAHVPGGEAHGYTIATDGTRFLTILSEGNGHPFYRQMDAEVSFPPNLADVVRIGTAHGIRFPQ